MAMLTNELRPKTLDDISGQLLAVNILKKFAENPETAPNCLLLYGVYGTGKTSAARAFAHAVNGIAQPNENATYITEHNCASFEYDLKHMNVSIENFLADTLNYEVLDKWDIVILDEIQGANEKIQTGMLKYIEGRHRKRFFIFCTTDINKVLDTLRSRCLPIEFKAISYNDTYNNLDRHAEEKGYAVSDNIKSLIAKRSNGHLRDAHIELQKYLSVGEDDYIANVSSYYKLMSDMFIAAYRGEKDTLINCLTQLSYTPLFTLKKEFDSFIVDCANAKYLGEDSNISEVKSLLEEYGDDFMCIVNFYTGIWDNSLFGSERHFYMHILSFYKDLEKKRVVM
jgi:DNA polymerase-3 subunit gamma/tau